MISQVQFGLVERRMKEEDAALRKYELRQQRGDEVEAFKARGEVYVVSAEPDNTTDWDDFSTIRDTVEYHCESGSEPIAISKPNTPWISWVYAFTNQSELLTRLIKRAKSISSGDLY
jgi:hypothetical protein